LIHPANSEAVDAEPGHYHASNLIRLLLGRQRCNSTTTETLVAETNLTI
jgi:hypothetical protein